MAWTEQDYQEIVARLKRESQGVGDVPEAESLDGITSLPAYQEVEGQDMPNIRRAPLTLLAAPALEAAEKANEAATNAGEKASAAEAATQAATEAATNTNDAIQNAKTATDAANASASSANQATENANTAASNANNKATLADTAAANANETAEHPTYIGTDHYVYKWNKTAKAYDKTDIYTKGDAFSIKKVYASVAELEADKSNPDIAEGDFVLVNTGDVEDPDNAKLYVKAGGDYEFLVDMSGAIGFTGKTPQFSMGTVTTLEAGASATATVSSDGTDEGGNPKYKLNFAIPRGNPGAPFKPVGQYDTLELLKQAIPDGSDVDGMIAVGTEAPYDYYAWLNGEWVSQGKVTGGNVIILPKEILDLTYQSTSEEILAVFGGIDKYKALMEKMSTGSWLIQIGEAALGSNRNVYTLVDYGILLHSNKLQGTFSLNIYNEQNQLRRFHFYLENNGTTARCGEASTFQLVRDTDVLTKTNTSPFTPTGDYQPSTKKYVDTTATKFVQLGTSNLNDFVGSDSEGFIGVQTYGANATLDRNYPIAESGILICAGSINRRTNQIYQTFNSNRIFTRGAGINEFTPWKEFVSINDVLSKTNTTEYTPTSDYHPAPKKYVDEKVSNIFDLEGFDFKTATQSKKEEFIKWAKGTNQVAHIVHDASHPIDDLYIPVSNYKHADYGAGEEIVLNFIAINCYSLNIDALIYIDIYNSDTGIIDLNSKVTIDIKRYNIDPDYIERTIVTSDNLTTVTRLNSDQYKELDPKDDKTMYAVTD